MDSLTGTGSSNGISTRPSCRRPSTWWSVRKCWNTSKTRPGGHAYISGAINAAHTDHIYLYRSPDEVRGQLEATGYRVLDAQIESNYPEKPEAFRPTIAGFLCRRAD